MELSIGLRRHCAAVMELIDGNVIKEENTNKTRIELNGTDAICTYAIEASRIHVQVTGQNIAQEYTIERVGNNFACSFRGSADSRSPTTLHRVVSESGALAKGRAWIMAELPSGQ